MRPIDADELFEHISHLSVAVTGLRSGKCILSEYAKHYRESVLRTVDEAPTVDAVPVVHGRWLKTQEPLSWTDVDCIECSNCHESWIIDEDCGFSDLADSWKYCTNCGAKMDGGNEE